MIITILRKHLDGTVANNVLKHGCGALNIDGTRIGSVDVPNCGRWTANVVFIHKDGCELKGTVEDRDCIEDCPIEKLDQQSGIVKGWSSQNHNNFNPYQGNSFHNSSTQRQGFKQGYDDIGTASRFFKQFKNISKEMIDYFVVLITPPIEDPFIIVSDPNDINFKDIQNESVHGMILLGDPSKEQSQEILNILKKGGHLIFIPIEDIGFHSVIKLDDIGFEVRDSVFVADGKNDFYYTSKASRSEREAGLGVSKDRENIHPTVKPIKVMEWCARDLELESKVVDPFLGSGTTGIACTKLKHDFVGVELNKEYAEIATKRIEYWSSIGTEIKSEAETKKDKKGMVSLF